MFSVAIHVMVFNDLSKMVAGTYHPEEPGRGPHRPSKYGRLLLQLSAD